MIIDVLLSSFSTRESVAELTFAARAASNIVKPAASLASLARGP